MSDAPARRIDGVRIGWYLLLAGIVFLAFKVYASILTYLLSAALIAYLLNPFVYMLERRRVPRWLGIVIVYVLLLALLTLGVWLLAPPFLAQARAVTASAEQYVMADSVSFGIERIPALARADSLFTHLGSRLGVDIEANRNALTNSLQNYVGGFINRLTDTLLQLLTLASYAVTIPIMTFFILLDHRRMRRAFLRTVPNRYFELTILLIEKIDRTIGAYMRAVVVEITVVAVLSAIALEIVGVQYSLVIGLLAGLANAVPYFGPVIGMALAGISALLSGGGLALAGWAAVSMVAVQVIDNNIVYPIVIGKNTQMHPLLIMLTVIAGGYVFGLVGMFLSVPVVFLVRGTLQLLHRNLKAFDIL